MSGFIDSHEREVATGLDLAVGLVVDREILHLSRVEVLLATPDKGLTPGLVAEPVADVVGVTSVDEDRDLLK